VLDGLEAETDGEVALADAGRAEDDDVLAVFDEVAGGEVVDLLLVERGLVCEVELLEAVNAEVIFPTFAEVNFPR
jgi:hypothetical protein